MVSTSYMRDVYDSIVGSPKEQSAQLDWERFQNRAGEFGSHLSGNTLSRSPKTPVMSELLRVIENESWRDCEKKGLPWIQKWYYPDEKEFGVFLSHDVDEIEWSWRRKLLMGVRHPSTLTSGKNHYWGFDEIMELERKLGVRSTFFFVSKRRHRRDPPYSIQDVADVIRELRTGGWEVGLHGSYTSFNNRGFLQEEKETLQNVVGEEISGVRQHFVNFDPAVTFGLHESIGFAYDSTIGYREVSGFASGVCHPYRFEGSSFYELPVMVIDGQLFWHEKKSTKGAIEEVERFLNTAKNYNGILTMDWHQRTVDGYTFPGWAEAYAGSLERIKSMNVFVATGEELLDWWKRRESVVFEGRNVTDESVEWNLLAERKIDDFSLRIRIPEGSRYKKPDVQSKVKFQIAEKENEIWIKFSAIPKGEKIGITMAR
ncbi:MAG: polysaccharide deacetylase family protein [Thermoplasmata archaeon]